MAPENFEVPPLSKGKKLVMREIVWNAHKSYFGDMKKKVTQHPAKRSYTPRKLAGYFGDMKKNNPSLDGHIAPYQLSTYLNKFMESTLSVR